jgi:adenine-specific DNA-methyltransferase
MFQEPTQQLPDQQKIAFDKAFLQVSNLVQIYTSGRDQFQSTDYSEFQARIDFIDKFWIALGWDVNHEHQINPYEQQVKVERSPGGAERSRRADYAFLAPNFRDVSFFVEAKRPGADIDNADDNFQVVRYGWNSHSVVSVLMNFEKFRVLDCRFKPDIDTARFCEIKQLSFHYSQYADRDVFSRIYYLFSRDAVSSGALERFTADLPIPRGKAVQRGLFPAGRLQPMDESFLEELDAYRASLASSFKGKNTSLTGEDLTETTQRTLDRLVFMRFLEDKLIESEPLVETMGSRMGIWEDFVATSRRLDRTYNGTIFKEHPLLDSSSFRVDGRIIEGIRERLAHTNSPYAFNYIPIHILGSIYERFLGKTIVTTAKTAEVVKKPEVRRAGGVYYTPEYIVHYIVKNTVGHLIADKTPEQIATMRFGDIACGSGSFLLGIYDVLLRRHAAFYNSSKRNRLMAKRAGCFEDSEGILHLSLRQKREILTNNIFGVDIDPQAVEVAQLSLYLKLLEEETTASARHYTFEFHEPLLPALSKNIVCGNSLVGWDFVGEMPLEPEEERKLKPFNFNALFPEILERGGFDALVGNPPYDVLEKDRNEASWPHDLLAEYVRMAPDYKPALGGKLNLFRFFIVRCLSLTRMGGKTGMIVPLALLADISCANRPVESFCSRAPT